MVKVVPITQVLVPAWKWDIKCPYSMNAEYVTVHNTANNASAMSEISYMIKNNDYVSYHYAVDDERAVLGIPLNRNGWHCGDGHGKGNLKSIGVEICHSLNPNNPRYAKSQENGAILVAMILKSKGWGIDRVRKHQDWSGKYCPHRILDNGDWQGFLGKVAEYLNELNGSVVEPSKKSAPAAKGTVKQSGTFRCSTTINVRNTPSAKGNLPVAQYHAGDTFRYDGIVEANGYKWATYISYSGVRRYVATGAIGSNEVWGKFM